MSIKWTDYTALEDRKEIDEICGGESSASLIFVMRSRERRILGVGGARIRAEYCEMLFDTGLSAGLFTQA